ncbi:hypothetical protein B0T10DRAFT_233590 [Thelonectria olida]|uniref:Uncharacterized protein n=1 Tax=Thelonectria olida TaxID=1576542 RepID=A0A9P9AJ79_9HYPO|nr:hypothetical protein B0T10DRAFT_233590 [Thelonectria olida]
MPTVEHLRFLLDSQCGLEVQRLMRVVQAPSLKSLSVMFPRIVKDDPLDYKSEEIIPAQFSELSISRHRGSPEAIATLLSWPSKLVSARISFDSSRYQHVDWPACRSMLLKHRQTLKNLEMEFFPPSGRKATCTLSDFTALESLSVSRCLLKRKLEPDDPVSDLILSPPELKSFTWKFASGNQTDDFRDIEEQWLRSLARLVLARESKLRKIHIEFRPMDGFHRNGEYPWDRMSRLKAEFEPMGIVFTYSDPRVSREEWEAYGYSSDEETSNDGEDWDWS